MILAEVNEQLWWYVARSSGFVSWGTVTLSVLWGLLLSTKLMGKGKPATWLLDIHRFLGGLSVTFLAVHLFGLWGDSYVTFGWAELFVPMASSWQPGPVAWGIVAMYLLIAVEITSMLMHRIPRKLWRWVHFSSFAIYVLATVHVITAGTDRTNPIFRWVAVASVQLVLFLMVARMVTARRLKRALREQSAGGTADDTRADQLADLRRRRRQAGADPAPAPVAAEAGPGAVDPAVADRVAALQARRRERQSSTAT